MITPEGEKTHKREKAIQAARQNYLSNLADAKASPSKIPASFAVSEAKKETAEWSVDYFHAALDDARMVGTPSCWRQLLLKIAGEKYPKTDFTRWTQGNP